MDGMSPGNALAIQTGIEHDTPRTEHFQAGSLNADQMWEVFGHAKDSPVILQTGNGGILVQIGVFRIVIDRGGDVGDEGMDWR